METEIIISISAVIIATVSAIFSFMNMSQSKRILRYQINLQFLLDSEKAICSSFDLIKLHNINIQMIKDDGISESEFCYILSTLRASEAYYVINEKADTLSGFRQNFLNNHKVYIVYNKYLKDRFFTNPHFRKVVDTYYQKNPHNIIP